MITDASELCLACGLCCSGSIFAEALVDPETDAQPLSTGAFDAAEVDGKPAFALGCSLLRGAECQIYDRQRPRVCGAFDCAVLRQWKQGQASGDDTLATVEQAASRDAEIRAELSVLDLPHPRNLADAKRILETRLSDPSSESGKRAIGQALVKLTAHQLHLKKVFLARGQQNGMTADSD